MFISKYSGSGNDFLIFHTFIKQNYSKLAKEICHRNNSLGADGLIAIYPHNDFDFEWSFYNSDGSIADMCGNASRCASLYSYTNKLTLNKKISFLSRAGEIKCEVKEDNQVSVKFPYIKIIKEEFEEFDLIWKIIDTGVPHLITINKEDEFSIKISEKMRAKYNANVNFIHFKNDDIYIRTFERGVENETLACGTGMASSFYYAKEKNLVKNNKAIIYPKSKEKIVVWEEDNDIYFQGEVKSIFSYDYSKF